LNSFGARFNGFFVAAKLSRGQQQDFAIDILESQSLRDDLSNVGAA
jgi:hypothetical protein